MNFGQALEKLKEGKAIYRIGWNAKNQFVYLVPENSYKATTDIAKAIADANGYVPYRAYMAIKTAQGDVATWVPSVSDCLAEDWFFTEQGNNNKMKDKITVEQDWFNKFALGEKALFFRRMLDELSKCQLSVFNSIDISYAINILSTVFLEYQEEQIYDNQKQ